MPRRRFLLCIAARRRKRNNASVASSPIDTAETIYGVSSDISGLTAFPVKAIDVVLR
jgi:hypothetical protein